MPQTFLTMTNKYGTPVCTGFVAIDLAQKPISMAYSYPNVFPLTILAVATVTFATFVYKKFSKNKEEYISFS